MKLGKIDALMNSVDKDGNHKIEFKEFYNMFKNLASTDLKAISKHWISSSGIDVGTDMGVPIPPPNIPIWRFFLAGGLGAIVARTATAPLERVKIIAQTRGLVRGVLEELRSIYHAEGVPGLFAGNAANLIRMFPYAGIVCTTNSTVMKLKPTNVDATSDSFWRIGAGECAFYITQV